MARQEIHFSELAAASGCKRRWQLSYQERLAPKQQDQRITVGTLVHAAMQSVLTLDPEGKQTPEQRLFWAEAAIEEKMVELRAKGILIDMSEEEGDEEYIAAVQEYANQEAAMVERSKEVAGRLLKHFDEYFTVYTLNGQPLVEYPLKVFLGERGFGKIQYAGTLDVVVRRKSDGLLFLGDFKVRGRMSAITLDLLHSQTALYQAALYKSHGISLHGSVVIQALNQPVKEVEITKAGVPSKRKASTTVEKYQAAMLQCGIALDDPAYEEVLANLRNKEWVGHTIIPRLSTSVEVRNTWDQVLIQGLRDIRAMEKLKGDRAKMIGYQCRTCQFYPLCEAELAGYDTDHVRDAQFYVRPE